MHRADKFDVGDVSPPAAGPSLPRCEHVWITRGTGAAGRLPGILLAFRRHLGRWEGWVVWATPGAAAAGGEPQVQLAWLDAEQIEPIG